MRQLHANLGWLGMITRNYTPIWAGMGGGGVWPLVRGYRPESHVIAVIGRQNLTADQHG
jgi:hypothetical protein